MVDVVDFVARCFQSLPFVWWKGLLVCSGMGSLRFASLRLVLVWLPVHLASFRSSVVPSYSRLERFFEIRVCTVLYRTVLTVSYRIVYRTHTVPYRTLQVLVAFSASQSEKKKKKNKFSFCGGDGDDCARVSAQKKRAGQMMTTTMMMGVFGFWIAVSVSVPVQYSYLQLLYSCSLYLYLYLYLGL